MDLSTDENYIISQAQRFRSSDPCAAKAWIITAKTLFPNNFNVQFEAYKLEKEANNYEEAAKCFSYITLTFQSQSVELWNEVAELTAALRAPENEITPEQEFYVKMFQHVSYDVQHKILLLTVNHTENNLEQCKLQLLILKRLPQAAVTHSPRLLEMIAEGMNLNPQKYQEILVEEALPLIYHKTPDLPSHLVCRIFTISLEYYIRQILEEENKCDASDIWKKIFQVLGLCGKILRWESFLPFNKSWSKNVYWEKLIEIASTSPPGSNQILFYTTTLFIYSLQEYIKNCSSRAEDNDVDYVLVEGYRELKLDRSNEPQTMDPPQISVTSTHSKEISKAFVNAAQCWQLLNTEQFQRDFSQLLIKLPLAPWISRFLFDLAVYFGHQEEAKKLMAEMQIKNSLQQNVQLLSLNLIQGVLTMQGFECILKILVDLPTVPGQIIENMTIAGNQRHVLFLPLTQKPIVQYCTRAIINSLSRKLFESNVSDLVLGDLLVLSQLDYPRETLLAEQIFSLIRSRGQFCYRLFPNYIVMIDYIEEFMSIWRSHNEEFNFEFSPAQANSATRRIGTRGADKGVREDFKQIIKQQILRANDSIPALVTSFIAQERIHLMQTIF